MSSFFIGEVELLSPPRGPHDLSRRGSRVVGRSDAVLHRFEEAKPKSKRMYSCIMTYPDEGRESQEGQMQSYTVSRRRSRSRNGCIVVHPL